jgi:hypothetical protein
MARFPLVLANPNGSVVTSLAEEYTSYAEEWMLCWWVGALWRLMIRYSLLAHREHGFRRESS